MGVERIDAFKNHLQNFWKGSQRFYYRWELTILTGESITITFLATFGATHNYAEGNLVEAGLIGLGGLALSGATFWRTRNLNEKTNGLEDRLTLLRKMFDHNRQVVRIPRRKNLPK